MREIKFRAWDKTNKEMVYPRIIKESFSAISSGDLLNKYEILMQFTGVKDKNGKEVFEGDILRSIGFYDRGKPYCLYHEVIFSDLYHMWYCVSLPKVPAESRVNNFLYACAKREFEVIGNIYENPKLLKPKKQLT